MKVSVNWIRQFVDFELPPIEELVTRIGAQLGGVESVEDVGARYRGAVIVRVVTCEPHTNSDHLHVCRVDDDGVTQGVERGEDGLVQVVCGAPNVRADMLAVWLPPGTTVPESYGKDPFVLGSRELRGVISNGMLASRRELALGDEHDGILELTDTVRPGESFAAAYKLDDYIIDIENKMFTHRPDCFGQLGVAREIAGILGYRFTSPDWYLRTALEQLEITAEPVELEVTNELPGLVPRFVAVALSGVTIKPSPFELQTWLLRAGVRPINNIVDITNYLMLETGQPLHAYDYDKLCAVDGAQAAHLVVRHPRSTETITLLNGKTVEPRPEAIMIATEHSLVGIAGVMGGSDTEVDDSTTRVVLEIATFDMYSIRRTSMAHGLFTDAVTRFNKGQSPLQNDEIAAKAVELCKRLSGAAVASRVVDNNHTAPQDAPRRWVHPPVVITDKFVNSRLGTHLTPGEIQKLLENVEFSVQIEGDQLLVTAPFWRTDVETREDIVEEAGRLYGFDKLPLVLPQRSIVPVAKNELLERKRAIREYLAKAGANEVLNYSFVHGRLLERAGQDSAVAFALHNALSPDLQYYRLSLTPSLLDKLHANVKAGYDAFCIFEIGKAHGRSEIDEAGLPKELERVAAVCTAGQKYTLTHYGGAAYFWAREYAMALFGGFHMAQRLRFVPLSETSFEEHILFTQMVQPFDPARAAVIYDGEYLVGVVGEYKPAVRQALKLPAFTAGFEVFLSAFSRAEQVRYVPLPRFPKVTQDMTLRVSADVPHGTLQAFVEQQLHMLRPQDTHATVTTLDIYRRTPDDATTQHTFRFMVASYERTFTDAEISHLLADITSAATQTFKAVRI